MLESFVLRLATDKYYTNQLCLKFVRIFNVLLVQIISYIFIFEICL